MPVDRTKAEKAVFEFLQAMGRDPARDAELAATPARVVEAWTADLIDGYAVDVPALLAGESSAAPNGAAGIITVRGLAVSTMCPHHLLPARGTAAVVYQPGARIAGIGTLARLLDAYAHRLVLQEVIGANVASALVEHLGARGAACKIALSHSCLSSRGERQSAAMVETIALAGSFDRPGPDRDLAVAGLAEPA
jgi:GTP cyclohydrolase IA